MSAASSSPSTPSPSSAWLDGPVIVGVDGSATSGQALLHAAHLARRLGVELVVVHAVGLLSLIDGAHVPSEGRRSELEDLVGNQWCASLAAVDGLQWRAVLRDGPPAEVVMTHADELGAALIVVGSRGVGSDALLGSTSHHVLHHADRPVLVVPPAGR